MHIRMMVLWDVVPCSLVNGCNMWEKSALFFFYPEGGGCSSLKHCYGKLDYLTLKTKVLRSFEALVITQCHIPEGLNLHHHDCDYLRSCTGAAPLNQNTRHHVPEGFNFNFDNCGWNTLSGQCEKSLVFVWYFFTLYCKCWLLIQLAETKVTVFFLVVLHI